MLELCHDSACGTAHVLLQVHTEALHGEQVHGAADLGTGALGFRPDPAVNIGEGCVIITAVQSQVTK